MADNPVEKDTMDQVVEITEEVMQNLSSDLSGVDLKSVVHDYLIPIIRNLAGTNRAVAQEVKEAFSAVAEVYDEVQVLSASTGESNSLNAIAREDFESMARVMISVFDVTQDRNVLITAELSQAVMGVLSRISAAMTATDLLQSPSSVEIPLDQIRASSVEPPVVVVPVLPAGVPGGPPSAHPAGSESPPAVPLTSGETAGGSSE